MGGLNFFINWFDEIYKKNIIHKNNCKAITLNVH